MIDLYYHCENECYAGPFIIVINLFLFDRFDIAYSYSLHDVKDFLEISV